MAAELGQCVYIFQGASLNKRRLVSVGSIHFIHTPVTLFAAPTQTHVLLRAPRRFSHAAWLPRQNVSATLDNMLQDFLFDSGLGDAASTGTGEVQRRRGVGGIKTKTEGVLVTCQNGPNNNDGTSSHPAATVPRIVTVAREEDELIWWAWHGKLIGFADW